MCLKCSDTKERAEYWNNLEALRNKCVWVSWGTYQPVFCCRFWDDNSRMGWLHVLKCHWGDVQSPAWHWLDLFKLQKEIKEICTLICCFLILMCRLAKIASGFGCSWMIPVRSLHLMLIWSWLKTSEGKENEGRFAEGKKIIVKPILHYYFLSFWTENSHICITLQLQLQEKPSKVSTFTCCVAYVKFLMEEN